MGIDPDVLRHQQRAIAKLRGEPPPAAKPKPGEAQTTPQPFFSGRRRYKIKSQEERSKSTDQRKQATYMNEMILAEMKSEATRQERPLSWFVCKAIVIALPTLKTFPGKEAA